ncbi:MAG: ferritin-like domain-containing protein [Polyangiaceae bacterium]|nr:ferritin-like domain-containing protein [Polyangiaceae bacterium]
MSAFLRFRASFARRILLAAGVAGGVAILGCGDDGETGGSGGNPAGGSNPGGGGEGVGAGSDGGNGGEGGQAIGGSSEGGAPEGGSNQGGDGGAGGGGGEQDVERCFVNPAPDAECPTTEQAPGFFTCTDMGETITEWISGPTAQDGLCCYQVDVGPPNDPSCGIVGRPLMLDQVPQRAAVRSSSTADRGWTAALQVSPSIAHLSAADRAYLARSWAGDAAFEHASVASFSKFSLELLAFGAPSDLVMSAHAAALDEVRHAQLGFALASAYAGQRLEPEALPAAGRVELATTPEAFVRAVVTEGCVGETVAALVAAAQLAVSEDPAVRAVLSEIAEDEARHAELAWRTVAWALRAFGPEMRAVVEDAFTRAIADVERAEIGDEAALHAHGRLSGEEAAAERTRGIAQIVRPSAKALLG